MKAIVYRHYGGPEVLQYVTVDKPRPTRGQVLVRVRASSINAADYRLMRADPFLARFANGLFKPSRQVLGMDLAGVVEELGEGATRFRVGDEVFGDAFEDGMGAFAEYVSVRESALAAKPPDTSFEEAATVPLAGVTALQGVRDKAAVKAGQRVLIQGAGGGAGTFMVQVAKALGAHVTAVCGPRNTELMASLGADVVLDYTKDDFTERDERYDAVLGVNGHRSLGDYARALARGGRYVMVGGDNAQIFDALLFAPFRFLGTGKTAGALTIQDSLRQGDLEQLAAWLAEGKLKAVIDQVFALRDAPQAMRYVEQGHVRGKVVLSIGGQ
jgi:NADPH:quinone reductase-like Zn-dependent oxidoreductase